MQVEEFLERSAERYPNKSALVCADKRWTYSEIEQLCNCLAHALVDNGVDRGDRVAVFLDNSAEAVLSIFATLKSGAVFLVINPTTKGDKLSYILNDCRAKCLVTDATRLGTVLPYINALPHLKKIIVAGETTVSEQNGLVLSMERVLKASGDSSSRRAPKRAIDIDLAALIYTSGSTGNPKGVMMTHLNIVSAATSITTYLQNSDDDVILNVLPLAFDYGLYQVLMGFKIGGTVVLERSFTYPYAIIQKLVQERVTGFPIVPTISAVLLQMNLEKYDLSSLRYITNTAAALPTNHIQKLRKMLPHVNIYSMYGLTECKRVSYLPPDQIDIRPTSVGKGMPNEEVYIVDEHGRRVGPGIVGELVVRGSNVMKGYWERPEETDKALRPGPLPGERVLYTGDLFRMDEEGYLYFVGRKDDIIKTRGEKVSPKEIENILYELDQVAEAIVVGVPDDILGMAIKAIISLKEGAVLTQHEVQRYCSQNLEDFMVPKFVEFRSVLPKNLNGKIDRRELGAMRI